MRQKGKYVKRAGLSVRDSMMSRSPILLEYMVRRRVAGIEVEQI